ncbi:HNH endonuclease [Kaistia adipata]|uniref:HNH endonuclease signature motif containing protein n=1 Tax=Kaistia adipata TaxID=166954 RepID=UPI0012EC8DDC|nr:HNH endonuclease [Kaistia adipata]
MSGERRRLTVTEKLEIMARQARCPRCHEKLGQLKGLDWDHSTPLALGGADTPENIQALHRTCHRQKTSGAGGERRASVADGDQHKIGKARRLSAAQAEFRALLLAKEPGMPREKKSRIPSRPFKRRSA